MDESACNYDMLVEQDNGSCEFAEEGLDCDGNCASGTLVTVDGGAWLAEKSWDITNCDGAVLAEGGAPFAGCVELGDNYALNLEDAYADGWDGTFMTINDDSYTVEAGATANFVIGSCGVAGCTDTAACNYNADATFDDGSCDVPGAGFDCDGNCISGTLVTVGGGSYLGEKSWDITNCDGDVLASGGAPFAGCVELGDNYALNLEDSYGDGWDGTFMNINDNSYTVEDGATANFEIGLCAPPVSCPGLDFNTVNTGTNMTLFFPSVGLSDGTNVGVYNTVGMCVGTGEISNEAVQIAVWGSEEGANNGAFEGETLTVMAQNDLGVYVSDVTFTYTLNGIEVVQNPVFEFSCSGDATSGCTDDTAFNFNADASFDDGSCIEIVVGCMDGHYQEYDASANTNNMDLCINWILEEGCMYETACNYNQEAELDDGSCEFAEDGFDCEGNCASGELLTMNDSWGDGWNGAALTINGVDYTISGISGTACVDTDGCVAMSWTPGSYDVETSWSFAGQEGSGGSDPSSFGDCTTGCTDPIAENYDSTAQLDDGSCGSTWIEIALSLQTQLENYECNEASPILVDIIYGWNILGYTLPYSQDVAATLADIIDVITIVKNNAAEIYWPEFGFNGIGDFIPGQGYQIKTEGVINQYQWPDVSGERLEMIPTVPQWAIDMEVDIHPNDIRTLVKVVNMLGQEVNEADQFSGEVLLYLFNDGTVEKKIVE
jgi:hypothetical protein